MILQRDLCVRYIMAAGPAPGVLFARLVVDNGDGSWQAAPLLRAEAVDQALIPFDPDEAALRLVDAAIRLIPALVLDSRAAGQLGLSAALLASCTLVLLVHEDWFRSLHALYRDGMEGVYSIVHAFTDAPAPGRLNPTLHCTYSQIVLTSSLPLLPSYLCRRSRRGPAEDSFPLGSTRSSVLDMAQPFRAEMLLQPKDELERQAASVITYSGNLGSKKCSWGQFPTKSLNLKNTSSSSGVQTSFWFFLYAPSIIERSGFSNFDMSDTCVLK
jgi:hypothetical protein